MSRTTKFQNKTNSYAGKETESSRCGVLPPHTSPRLQQLPLVSNDETPSLPLSPAAHKRTKTHKAGTSRKRRRSAGSGCLKLVQMGRLTMPSWVCVVAALQIGTLVVLRDPEGGHGLPSHGSEARVPVSRQVAVTERWLVDCGSWCSSAVHSDWCRRGRGPWLDRFNAVDSNWTESERASQRNSPSELRQRGKQRAMINDLFSFQLPQQWLRGRREYQRANSEVRIIQNQQRWTKRRRLMNSDPYTHTSHVPWLVHGNTLRVSKTDYTCNIGHLSHER